MAIFNVNASGLTTVITGDGVNPVKVYKLLLVASAAVTVTFEDSTGRPLSGAMTFSAGSTVTLPFDTRPWMQTAPGLGFGLNCGTAVPIGGLVLYTQSTP
jgi:hypothetical protein